MVQTMTGTQVHGYNSVYLRERELQKTTETFVNLFLELQWMSEAIAAKIEEKKQQSEPGFHFCGCVQNQVSA